MKLTRVTRPGPSTIDVGADLLIVDADGNEHRQTVSVSFKDPGPDVPYVDVADYGVDLIESEALAAHPGSFVYVEDSW